MDAKELGYGLGEVVLRHANGDLGEIEALLDVGRLAIRIHLPIAYGWSATVGVGQVFDEPLSWDISGALLSYVVDHLARLKGWGFERAQLVLIRFLGQDPFFKGPLELFPLLILRTFCSLKLA